MHGREISQCDSRAYESGHLIENVTSRCGINNKLYPNFMFYQIIATSGN